MGLDVPYTTPSKSSHPQRTLEQPSSYSTSVPVEIQYFVRMGVILQDSEYVLNQRSFYEAVSPTGRIHASRKQGWEAGVFSFLPSFLIILSSFLMTHRDILLPWLHHCGLHRVDLLVPKGGAFLLGAQQSSIGHKLRLLPGHLGNSK